MKISKKILYIILPIILLLFLSVTAFQSMIVKAENNEQVYLGGQPIGLLLRCKGAIVSEFKDIVTPDGSCNPARDAGVMIGDNIIMAGNISINSPENLIKLLSNLSATQENITLKISRLNKQIEIVVKPKLDIVTNTLKLGIMVRNELTGIGTLTFVTADGLRFAGLGHRVFDGSSLTSNNYNEGHIYTAEIIDSVKGQIGVPGELRGTFNSSSIKSGKLDKNEWYGVYGDSKTILHSGRPKIKLASKNSVKRGTAYIYTTIEGKIPEKYEINIVKTMQQETPGEKGMVIKVTDKRLINKTGGILQGMSGSPIVQDGLLIGAVTHVFLNDPTLGFGIYIDWMLNH